MDDNNNVPVGDIPMGEPTETDPMANPEPAMDPEVPAEGDDAVV